MTSSIETARSIDPTINALGAGLMFHPSCIAVGADHGLDNGFAFYAGGRCGVVGDAPTEVVAAAAAWFQPGTVAAMLDAAREVGSASELASWYAEGLGAAAKTSWGGIDGLDRFCALAFEVIDAVPSAGLALFTGWRRQARPDDPAAASGVAIQTLREFRGDRHIQAMAGFSPLEAVLTSVGADRAKLFGWTEPFPDVTDLADRRHQAEVRTDELMALAYDVLDETEQGELVALVESMKLTASERRAPAGQ